MFINQALFVDFTFALDVFYFHLQRYTSILYICAKIAHIFNGFLRKYTGLLNFRDEKVVDEYGFFIYKEIISQ